MRSREAHTFAEKNESDEPRNQVLFS
jgi:hypothetical protein